ncbi:hypothetical protein KP509_27G043500 [Ceratopteris richardii]|uniref:MI domain-containing protein n=1 Tax=Ceratopteris richardii TaxID=49495 RepID=A0A8T2RHQ4_CERRI|nr:hypothetical protein KP509_27G043500 [Ceratopteris richardii]
MSSPQQESFLTEEQRVLLRNMSFGTTGSASESLSPRGTSELTKQGSISSSPPTGKGISGFKLDRRSHSGKLGRPKKGGAGGRGTWGSLLETGGELRVDRNDPNYNSDEEPYKLVSAPISQSLEDYKAKVVQIIEEYFTIGNIVETAADLRELGSPMYHHHFIKKVVSVALDRHDREKEMTAVLLSALYADVIDPDQVAKGFGRLVESADDLAIDIPDAVDILALFVARAVVDDILPPAFLKKIVRTLPEGALGHQVINKAEKSYLLPPLHAAIVEQRWGGSTHSTVEEVRKKVTVLLNEYIESGDKVEACRCIRELNVPFFHHDLVKRALNLAMERRNSEGLILSLLKEADDEGLITSSQMAKGFARLADVIDDLSLDIPQAKPMFLDLVSKAIDAGFLSSSSANNLMSVERNEGTQTTEITKFKQKAASIIQEYFLADDVGEVIRSLEDLGAPSLYATFVKKLITSAMDRKKREKEMTSVLLSSLFGEVITAGDVVEAFVMLLEVAEDTALDIPDASNQLSLFLARAVIDEILAPLDLEEINEQLKPGSLGAEIVRTTKAVLAARHAGERVLRCWGGSSGWPMEDAKDKIIKLLEEYQAGGELSEACHCIRELDMPFFHHEVVKKALIMAMEKQSDRLLSLLQECFNEGLISVNQMIKGFSRVADGLDDIGLDIPKANDKFRSFVEKAKSQGWLSSAFGFSL